jgi:FkbM family methyltransferase
MTRVPEKIGAIFTDIAYILSPHYKQPRRGRLLADYARMRLKVFLNNWIYFKDERFLSYRVVFANYSLFFEEFRQTFIRHSYYFETDKEAPSIIDCGGNMGMSLLYFKYLYPRSTVTIFEPSAAILPVIKKNIAENNLTGVKLEEYAVSREDGQATFFDRGTGSCGSTLLAAAFENDAHKKANRAEENVVTKRLSPYIQGDIDMLKMDIEGAEGDVIQELSSAHALSKIKNFALEYHYFPGNKTNPLGPILVALEKEKRNYQIFLDELVPGASVLLSKTSGYYCLIRSPRDL